MIRVGLIILGAFTIAVGVFSGTPWLFVVGVGMFALGVLLED